MNEAALAYHRHCLSRTEKINKTFLSTLEFVADELLAQAEKDDPQMDLDYIKGKILQRRYNIQYKLDYTHMKDGCSSTAINMAKTHYQEFSRYNRQEISQFINDSTDG